MALPADEKRYTVQEYLELERTSREKHEFHDGKIVPMDYNLPVAIPVPKKRHTVEEYLQLERQSLEKHEFHNGEIFAMAGGTRNHSLIIANVIGEIRSHLKGKPCRVYDSNLRVRVPGASDYSYPDATVICGESRVDASDPGSETVSNPRLIVEVVSPNSEAYDRGGKFDQYRSIESLQEYVLVTQDSARVETFYRQGGGSWLMTPISGLDKSVKLRSLEIDLSLAEIYAGVEFPAPTPPMPSTP